MTPVINPFLLTSSTCWERKSNGECRKMIVCLQLWMESSMNCINFTSPLTRHSVESSARYVLVASPGTMRDRSPHLMSSCSADTTNTSQTFSGVTPGSTSVDTQWGTTLGHSASRTKFHSLAFDVWCHTKHGLVHLHPGCHHVDLVSLHPIFHAVPATTISSISSSGKAWGSMTAMASKSSTSCI